MGFEEILKVGNAILISLGGGAIIVFALSSWLGKIWANRIMAKDRTEYSKELENLRIYPRNKGCGVATPP